MATQLNYLIAKQQHAERIASAVPISLRPVHAGDRAGLSALFARLSPKSRYLRFLSPKPSLTSSELTFLSDVDHVNHEAIAAVNEHDGSIVGVARYVRHTDQADAAEVAIEVADAFQRMGIGTALADITIQRAHENGVKVLTATTLGENHAVHELLRQHGFRIRRAQGIELKHELKLAEEKIGKGPRCERERLGTTVRAR